MKIMRFILIVVVLIFCLWFEYVYLCGSRKQYSVVAEQISPDQKLIARVVVFGDGGPRTGPNNYFFEIGFNGAARQVLSGQVYVLNKDSSTLNVIGISWTNNSEVIVSTEDGKGVGRVEKYKQNWELVPK